MILWYVVVISEAFRTLWNFHSPGAIVLVTALDMMQPWPASASQGHHHMSTLFLTALPLLQLSSHPCWGGTSPLTLSQQQHQQQPSNLRAFQLFVAAAQNGFVVLSVCVCQILGIQVHG